ncbi:hypothetical protein [Arthrobacter sp. B0490]|uniref:hypothetical protein n=1 Tax=Arthrobacter sp. B0490 TaxID=2058891 RepID=UPI000CE431C9|nr:hypothetical protein [Arthrobacter sp. B0490]
MNASADHPNHDESADQELSASLAGHDDLPKHDGDEPTTPGDASAPAAPAEDGDALEEIEDSPVRTKNS